MLPFDVQVSVLPFNEHWILTEFALVKTPPTASTVDGAAGVWYVVCVTAELYARGSGRRWRR